MSKIKSVAVFCGAQFGEGKKYEHVAKDLGNLLVKHGIQLVYGAGGTGLMGVVAQTVLDQKGDVYGVTTKGLAEFEPPLSGIELDLVPTIQQRKRMMMDAADAFIVLPGGIGTLDEISEVLVAHQIGDHDKPMILMSIDGYFEPFINLVDEMIEEEFISASTRKLFKYELCHRVDDVLPTFKKMGYTA